MITEQLLEKKDQLEHEIILENLLVSGECNQNNQITILVINQKLKKLPEETRIFLNELGI